MLAFAGCDNPAGGNGGGATSWITGPGLWNADTQTNTGVSIAGDNALSSIIIHANSNQNTPLILAVGGVDVTGTSPAAMTGANLTIVGFGAGQRTVSFHGSTNRDAPLFQVGSNARLTLGSGIRIIGGPGGHNAALIRVNDGGTFIMESGSTISGFRRSSSGSDLAAVVVNSGGVFTMNSGATITGNEAFGTTQLRVGGVFVADTGTFTRNGNVTGNTPANVRRGGTIED